MISSSTSEPIFIIILIGIFYSCDILSTYFFLKKFKKEFPTVENWEDNEINPIANLSLKKFGLRKGMIIALLVTLPLIITIMIMASFSEFMFGLVIGIYLFLFRVHLESWSRLFKAVKKRNEIIAEEKKKVKKKK